MKKLLNTLYVLTPESYLYHRNENICVKVGGEEKVSIPALTLENIVCFGVNTVSTPLIGFCGEKGIALTFLSGNGRFLGRVTGPVSGNVLLRTAQYASTGRRDFVDALVRDMLYAKLRNSKEVLLRAARGNLPENDAVRLKEGAQRLSALARQLADCSEVDSMRGIEGAAASEYFSCFDCMLRTQAHGFALEGRSRRPPKNEVNAALSFTYTLLASEMRSALESVGLDPAVGYLHALRPGRASFALDMMEELRAALCDRFVISLFNLGQLSLSDFEADGEAVYLDERGRKTLLTSWQKRKGETIVHPFLQEKIPIGLIPYAQAMLFARVLRGDLDRYPPFVWR